MKSFHKMLKDKDKKTRRQIVSTPKADLFKSRRRDEEFLKLGKSTNLKGKFLV